MAPRYPYVLFDLGNTLIYFQGVWSEVVSESCRAAARALIRQGYALDEQGFAQAFEDLAEVYYRRREEEFTEYPAHFILGEALRAHGFANPPADHLRAALRDMYAVSQAHWFIEADTIPTLEALRACGCRLGLISNAADDEDVQKLIDNAGIRSYFDVILVSAAFGRRKPGPAIFLRALETWQARPEQAVMVGDTLPADIEGANRLGITSVWIRQRADNPANGQLLALHPPRVTIDALSELPALVGCSPAPGPL